MKITPSILFNYLQCPHKVWRDVYGPKDEEVIEDNPFLQLLWEKGVQHEKEVVEQLTGQYFDASKGNIEERLLQTLDALNRGEKYIYQGVIQHGNLFGIPDLLRLGEDDYYVPIDIKSGAGFEGADEDLGEEGKPKKHYAVQLCVYAEILIANGFAKNKRGYILDIHKDQVEYDLTAKMGARSPQTFWDFYEETKGIVIRLLNNDIQNNPAMAGICKMCSWYSACKNWCVKQNDATQLFYLGRKVRDTLQNDLGVSSVSAILDLKPEELIAKKKKNKEFLKGIGEGTLTSAIRRADIYANKKPPVLYSKIYLPEVSYELFFDIEDDPTQEFVYLHGVYVRNKGEKFFKAFYSKDNSEAEEKRAWAEFWQYVRSLPKNDYAVYYYSAHEKSTYKRMQKKYPDVISAEDVERFFEDQNVIDLYNVVLKNTDWPLGSYGIKAIATYLGFSWRDHTPSGALSIQWYNDYLKNFDQVKLQRILDYNEDDCIATMALKDKLYEMNNSL